MAEQELEQTPTTFPPARNAARIRAERDNEIKQLKEDLATLQAENEKLQPDMIETKTPVGDLSWYLKWGAALSGIVGAFLTAGAIAPWNVAFGLISMILWIVVGILWNDRAIMLMNAVMAGAFTLSYMIDKGWATISPVVKTPG